MIARCVRTLLVAAVGLAAQLPAPGSGSGGAGASYPGVTSDGSNGLNITGGITTGSAGTNPGGWSPTLTTVANLSTTCGSPSCPFQTGTIREVSDGTSTSDCTVGGGTSKALCKYNGAAWEAVTGGGMSASGFYLVNGATSYCGPTFQVCTPASGVTIQNTAGSSTVNSVGGTQVLQVKAALGENMVFAGVTIAGGNTTATIAYICQPFPGTVMNYTRCGAGLYESATGKMLHYETTSVAAGATSVIVRSWTNQTTLGTSRSASSYAIQAGVPMWAKFTCSVAGCQSGNVTVQASADGLNYTQGFTEAVTADFTTGPNRAGVGGVSNSTSDDFYVTILSLKLQ